MTTKSRLAKLESARPGVEADDRPLLRVIHGDGNKYFIDGVEVGEDVFLKAERAQSEVWQRLHPGERERIVINFIPPLPEDADGIA